MKEDSDRVRGVGDLQHCQSYLYTHSIVGTGGSPEGQALCPFPLGPLHSARNKDTSADCCATAAQTKCRPLSNFPIYSGPSSGYWDKCALGGHGITGHIINQVEVEEDKGLQVGGRRVGCGRQRGMLDMPGPLPDPFQCAACDRAPPGQGAEKIATGGEEAATTRRVVEAGFGVSLCSCSSRSSP